MLGNDSYRLQVFAITLFPLSHFCSILILYVPARISGLALSPMLAENYRSVAESLPVPFLLFFRPPPSENPLFPMEKAARLHEARFPL